MTTALARRLGAACLTAACLLGSATAQTPQALKIIVPYPAGGTADILPRVAVCDSTVTDTLLALPL